MDTNLIMTIAGVIAAFVILAFLIRRYPLRFLQRDLRCPAHNLPARVRFFRQEVGFGNIIVTDVASCSLYPEGDLPCDKHCIK